MRGDILSSGLCQKIGLPRLKGLRNIVCLRDVVGHAIRIRKWRVIVMRIVERDCLVFHIGHSYGNGNYGYRGS